MKTIKVFEATELQLDWLVAKCMAQVHKDQILYGTTMYGWWISGLFTDPNQWISLNEFKPSTDWAQGGPIKEKHQISTTYCGGGVEAIFNGHYGQGPTELIATMRCYVTSKLGDTAEVPEELT